jgi:hypothetical protein
MRFARTVFEILPLVGKQKTRKGVNGRWASPNPKPAPLQNFRRIFKGESGILNKNGPWPLGNSVLFIFTFNASNGPEKSVNFNQNNKIQLECNYINIMIINN